MAKNNAKLPDIQAIISAGIDPKTKLPTKLVAGDRAFLENDIRKLLRIKDEAEAVNRFNWYNTGLTINSPMIERFLYYKYKLGFFFFNGGFWLMPVTLSGNGTLDFYNLENEVTPIPYNDSANADTKKLLSQIKLKVVKEPLINPTLEDMEKSCVIIRDYTPQSDINGGLPRATLQEGIINLQSSILPYMRTNLMNNAGVQGIRVNDEQEADDILEASNTIDRCAKSGTPWIPILQHLDVQALTNGVGADSSAYLQAYQAIENLRQSFLGINKSGIYDKSQYVNAGQTALNNPIEFALADGLKQRQDACDIINSIWGLGIWCEASETALGMDRNGDLIADDDKMGGQTNELDTQEQPTDVS